ncbi:hypothetical protein OROGR_007731 [Orobanche gracilis]
MVCKEKEHIILGHRIGVESRYPTSRLTPAEVHLIEDRIAAHHREIQNLLLDNHCLASIHVALKQDVATAQDDLRRFSAAASSVKADRDAQVREIYQRKVLLKKLKDVDADIASAQSELRQMPDLKSEIEAMQGEIQRGRAAVEYEIKMHSTNSGVSETIEKHMISMASEAEKLRPELANAEKRAMAMAAISAVHPGPGFDLFRY